MPEDSFTATQIARALQRSKRSVLESLKRTPLSATKVVHGNQARVWSKDRLPQTIVTALEDVAARRKTSIDELLVSLAPFWRPRYPLSQLFGEAIERTAMLKRALAPALARLNDVDLTSAEFEQLGVEDYRSTFGHSVSTRHWRRLLRRTLDRDGGAENWGRLEIYLDESPARRPGLRKPAPSVSVALRPLQELISSFANPAEPTDSRKIACGFMRSSITNWRASEPGNQKRSNAQRSRFFTRTHHFSGNRRRESKSSSIES